MKNEDNSWKRGMIGTAWSGKHVVSIRCNPFTNSFLQLSSSLHAPLEPTHYTCMETLSTYLSIGYTISTAYSLPNNEVIYILVKS